MVPKTLYYNLNQGNNDPRQWGFSVDVCMWEGGGQGLIYIYIYIHTHTHTQLFSKGKVHVFHFLYLIIFYILLHFILI